MPVGQTATPRSTSPTPATSRLTLTKAAPPVGAFNTATPVSEGQQLSPGDVIHQTVTFTPSVQGAQSAVYSITGDDGQGAVLVQLTGTGVTGTGTTNLAAGRPATSSSAQGGYPAANATDTDAGSYWESANNAFPQWIQVDLGATTTIGKVTVKVPPAAAWATRPQTYRRSSTAPPAPCSKPAADYTFDPATGNTADIAVTAGVRQVRLQITGNTGWPAGQVSSLEVYGSGGGPATLAPNPASLTFEGTAVNANSDWRTVTVTNTGTGPATVSGITATGDFTRVTTCGTVIAAGANCTVTVTFHPTAAGTRTGRSRSPVPPPTPRRRWPCPAPACPPARRR